MKTQIFYDNWCSYCTRFSKFVHRFDWLSLIEMVSVRDILMDKKYPELDRDRAIKEMASFDGNWRYGFDSIFLIFKKLPIFWLFLPLMYLLKILKIGQYLYIQLAVRRQVIPIHCNDQSCEIPGQR